MSFSKHFNRRSFGKLVNVCAVLVLLFSTIAPGAAQAASSHTAPVTTNGNCEVATDNTIFLPLISSAASAIASGVQGVFASPQVVERQLKYTAGKTYVYDYNVTVTTTSSQRDSQGTNSSDKSKTVMAAKAEVTITGQDGNGDFDGTVVMSDPFICSADLASGTDSSPAAEDIAVLATELAKPLVFKQKANGVIAAVSYPADAKPTVTNLQKGVINALQTLLQEGDTYKAAELGGQGTYTATYTLSEANDQLNIVKSYDEDSFSDLNKKGDEVKSLQMDSKVTAVLDGAKGVIDSVSTEESLITGDGSAEPNDYTDPNVTFDGTTAWTTVTSAGTLKLSTIKDASAQAAALFGPYVDGSLEATFEDQASNDQGIDIEAVDLDAEFAAFEVVPADTEQNPFPDPAKFQRILDLINADQGTEVFDKLVARLAANASNDLIAKGYIDLLTAIGTPEAQNVLTEVIKPSAQAASISATMSISTQEQALIGFARIESPSQKAVDTLGSLSADGASQLQSTAISVLGAAIDNLKDEDPTQAQSLADGLVSSLNSATEQDMVETYLDALGNAGVASTADKITEYTNISNTSVVSETEIVEASAYNALRKIPGEAIENTLVAALQDTNQPNGTRLLVADILANRADLSAQGAAALADFQIADLASGGTYSRSWGGWLGNSKLGIHLPGKFTVSSINQLYLYADQQANGYVWNNSFSVARGQLLSHKYGNYQKFGAYLNIGGNLISKKYETYLTCNYSKSGTLYSGSYSWKKRFNIPVVWVITIGVDVKVSINGALDYAYGANVCNLNNSSLYGGVTPRVWAGLTAEAYLNLRLARGGVGINATILNTLLPVKLTLTYNGSTFRFCSDIKVITYPLSGYIYAFADVGIDYWLGAYWKRIYQGNLATFSVGQYTYNILVRCW
ncbi:MAG: hypothetical protein R3C14_33215 [Caldilineaceae bacterium]